MTTPATLARKLRNRIPDLDALEIASLQPFVFKVTFSSKGPRCRDEVTEDVREVLSAEKTAGCLFELEEFRPGGPQQKAPVPLYLSLAGLASDQTLSGLPETLVAVVHDLAKVFIEEEPGKVVTFRVAKEDGSAPPDFLDRVRTALGVIGYAGLPFEVKAVDPKNPHHRDMKRAGFMIPDRHPRLVDFTEDDNNRYAQRIRRLVDGQHEEIPIVDAQCAGQIYLTPGVGRLDIGALLPLYERIYVELPLSRNTGNYFEDAYGLDQRTFIELCRAGAVVPVFRRNAGLYPESVWRQWLEDPSLPLLSPRDADFVGMRHLWNTSRFIRDLRNQPDQFRAIDEAMRRILNAGNPTFQQNRWLYEVLGWMRQGAEEFEGIAFHRGTLALGNLSAGGAAAHLLASQSSKMFADKAIADTIAIEGFVASQNIAMAQAFGASLFDNLVLNTTVLSAIAPMFQEALEVNGRLETRRITELVKALEIHHSARIPVGEYLEVMSAHETARIRVLVQNLLSGVDGKSADRELRERVTKLNQEVRSIDKKDLQISTADVLGDASSMAGSASGGSAYGMVLLSKLLGGAVAGKLATKAVDSLLDGPAGSGIDAARGALNGVSPQAIRIFRLRSKLKR
jgi:hypothetical protein